MPRRRKPLFSDPSFPVLETEIDLSRVYCGNRILARCAGAARRWLVQCLRCSRRMVRREKSLLSGRGSCQCRNSATNYVPRCIKYADRMNDLQSEKKEWKRIIALYGDKVDPKWRADFLNFVKDMGRRPCRKYICRRTSLCVLRKATCRWGTQSEAEWEDTIYLHWKNRRRRVEEIPELKGIPRDYLLRLIKRAPMWRNGEWIVKRWQRDQFADARKKHQRDQAKKRSQSGDNEAESA